MNNVKSIKKRVLAGIRPTNRLHIGNYLGVVKGMLELQSTPNTENFYMVADLHALTTPYNKETLKETRTNVIIDYLACGLDPEKSTLFVQSMVPEHTELAYYFSTVVNVARMRHLPTFKEKVKQHPESVTMALLHYPVLMAADILIYKAHAVPVGKDQKPHIEVAREIARKMNELYGISFPIPDFFATAGAYVPSLLGEGKMSKSVEGSYINLLDDLETIKSRLAKVPTDNGKGTSVPKAGSISNLLTFVEHFQGREVRKEYEQAYITTGLRYKDLKDSLAVSIYEVLQPIQERRAQIAIQKDYVEDMLNDGAKKARTVAHKTVNEVRESMGL